MKLGKIIASIAVLGMTTLFAVGVSGVSDLVDKINKTSDLELKTELMEKLKTELSLMNKDEKQKAQEIVNAKMNTQMIEKK